MHSRSGLTGHDASSDHLDALTAFGKPEFKRSLAPHLADEVGGVPPVALRADGQGRGWVDGSAGVLLLEVVPATLGALLALLLADARHRSAVGKASCQRGVPELCSVRSQPPCFIANYLMIYVPVLLQRMLARSEPSAETDGARKGMAAAAMRAKDDRERILMDLLL